MAVDTTNRDPPPSSAVQGPMLIGTILGVSMFGVLFMQGVTYMRKSHDAVWRRVLVLLIISAVFTNATLASFFTYTYTVNRFGDFNSMLYSSWATNSVPAMTGIITFFVHTVYAWRLRELTNTLALSCSVLVLSFIQLCFSLVISVVFGKKKDFYDFEDMAPLAYAWFSVLTIANLLVSGSLLMHARKTGSTVDHYTFVKIYSLVFQSGGIALLWGVIDLIVYAARDNRDEPTQYYLIFTIPWAALQAICLLTHLNARKDSSAHKGGEGQSTNIRNIQFRTSLNTEVDLNELHHETRNGGGPGRMSLDAHTLSKLTKRSNNPATTRSKQNDGLSLRSDSIDDDLARYDDETIEPGTPDFKVGVIPSFGHSDDDSGHLHYVSEPPSSHQTVPPIAPQAPRHAARDGTGSRGLDWADML